MRRPFRRLPRDAVVLTAFGDLAFPLAPTEPDLLLPRDLVAVFLLHVQDAMHELREVLEFRPPRVHDVDRRRDVRPALNRQATRLPPGAPAAAQLLGGLAGEGHGSAAAFHLVGGLAADFRGLFAALVFRL